MKSIILYVRLQEHWYVDIESTSTVSSLFFASLSCLPLWCCLAGSVFSSLLFSLSRLPVNLRELRDLFLSPVEWFWRLLRREKTQALQKEDYGLQTDRQKRKTKREKKEKKRADAASWIQKKKKKGEKWQQGEGRVLRWDLSPPTNTRRRRRRRKKKK